MSFVLANLKKDGFVSMKRFFLSAFAVCVFFAALPAFAQMGRDPAYVILVTPVDAPRELQEDSAKLYDALVSEFGWQGQLNSLYALAETRSPVGDPPNAAALSPQDQALNPRYVLTERLAWDEGIKVLTLNLYQLDNSAMIGNQELGYSDLEQAQAFMAFFCWSLSSTLPPDDRNYQLVEKEDITWKNKWLYLGGQIGASPGLYVPDGNGPWSLGVGFNVGFRAEAQFLTFSIKETFASLSVRLGMDFNLEKATYRDLSWNASADQHVEYIPIGFSSSCLTLPLVLRANFKPGKFIISPYGGAYFILPLGTSTYDLPLGYTLGLNAGRKAGPGLLYLDLQFSSDIGTATIPATDALPAINYHRRTLAVTVGYEFGLFDRAPLPVKE
jgi:hypothetical protein